MKPYAFSGLLMLLFCALLSFYSLGTWSHRFVYPAAAKIEAHDRYLTSGRPSLPQAKTPIGLMQPRIVQVELADRS